jgi:hypothetical protein
MRFNYSVQAHRGVHLLYLFRTYRHYSVVVVVEAGFSTSQDDLGKTKRSLGLAAAYLVSS